MPTLRAGLVRQPAVLPLLLPEGKRFDAVVILDAEATSLQSALAAVSRAQQVVAFGDDKLAAQRPSKSPWSAGTIRSPARPRQPLTARSTRSAAVLPVWRLSTVYRAVDEDLARSLSDKFYEGSLSRLPGGQLRHGAGPA